MPKQNNTLDKHYTMLAIEPFTFFTANKLNFAEANAIKYISRYKNKNGLEDIKKAEHYLQILEDAIKAQHFGINTRNVENMSIPPQEYCKQNNITGDNAEFISSICANDFKKARELIKQITTSNGGANELITGTALQRQVGGNHYAKMSIQPMHFISKNNMDFGNGNIIKYISRYKNKNGLEDLEKALQQLQLLQDSKIQPQHLSVININEYCQKNNITGLDKQILQASFNGDYSTAINNLQDLIANYKDCNVILDYINKNIIAADLYTNKEEQNTKLQKIYAGTLDISDSDKQDIYSNLYKNINSITKKDLPADLQSDLIDLARLRVDLAVKIALDIKFNNGVLVDDYIVQSQKIVETIKNYKKAKNILDDKESLFNEIKTTISQDDELFLKNISYNLAGRILQDSTASAIYQKNYEIVNELSQKQKEMENSNANLIDLAIYSVEIATLKLVQEHYPKNSISQAISEKLAIDKIQEFLVNLNNNSLFDKSFSKNQYFADLLYNQQNFSDDDKNFIYKNLKDEIETVTATFINNNDLNLENFKVDLALKIISASALKENLETIPELKELPKINQAILNYENIKNSINNNNLFNDNPSTKSVDILEVKSTGFSTIDKALNTIHNSAQNLLNQTPKHTKLRDYQQECIDALLSSNKGLIKSPTGSGKTHIITGLIEQSGLSTIVVTPSVALATQAVNTIKKALPHLNVSALGGLTKNKEKALNSDVVVSTWQSLAKQNLANLPHKMLIVDECHHATADVLQSIIQKLDQQGLRVYGLSATTYRTTQEQNEILRNTFNNFNNNVVKEVNIEDLYAKKYLVRPTINIITPTQKDFSYAGLKSCDGTLEHIFNEANKPENDFIGKICNYAYAHLMNANGTFDIPYKVTPNGEVKPSTKSDIYKAKDILQNYFVKNPDRTQFCDILYSATKQQNYILTNSTEQEQRAFALIAEYLTCYTNSKWEKAKQEQQRLRQQPNGNNIVLGTIKSGIDSCRNHQQEVMKVVFASLNDQTNRTLILTNTKDFAKSIIQHINEFDNKTSHMLGKKLDADIIYIDGEQKNKDELLNLARNSTNYILVSTVQSMGEGVDVPNIEKVIVASPAIPPLTNIAAMEQIVGRAIRPFEDKSNVEITLFDFNIMDYTNKQNDVLNIINSNLRPTEFKVYDSVSNFINGNYTSYKNSEDTNYKAIVQKNLNITNSRGMKL